MNILLVEDDKRISDFVVKGLQENNYSVTLAVSAEEARDLLEETKWDLILLDIMLPGMDGVQFAKMVRYKKNHTPILILSALSDSEEIVNALDSGADDYLIKPFHFKELLSRIKAITRRAKLDYDRQGNILEFAGLKINTDQHIVEFYGEVIDLSPKEFRLLLYLAENKDKVLSRTQILYSVWGIDYENNTNVVDVYISYLRNKLESENKKIIHTVKGVGYMLKA
jgi:two-component system OmpR family response regulator